MEADYVPGALYLAGFTQARSPHLGLLLGKDTTKGTLFHIRINRETSPNWEYQCRTQPVVGDMFLSSLLRIKEVPLPLETAEQTIEEIATELPPPDNGEFGECGPWVLRLVQALHKKEIVELENVEKLGEEVDLFARNSRPYARRDKFPNLSSSKFCR